MNTDHIFHRRLPLSRRGGLALAAAGLVLAAATTSAQERPLPPELDPTRWEWPAAASDPAVRQSIIQAGYTAQELRNIRAQLDALSGGGRAPRGAAAAASAPPPAAAGASGPARPSGWAERSAPNVKIVGRGFRGLEVFYGSNGYINGPEGSIADRKNRVEYILAKGDRVVVAWFIEGHHTGPLFGFPGTGKPLQIRETAWVRYNEQGQVVEADFIGDDLALYAQAGGQVVLPKQEKK